MAKRWRSLARLTTLVVLVALAVVLPARTASAHNSLEFTDPPTNAMVEATLDVLRLRFANATPLETVQVELIDASGARKFIVGLRHGASDREVLAPVAPGLHGAVVYRWRLVGTDGHVVSGRVQLTLPAAPGASGEASAIVTPADGAGTAVGAPMNSSEPFAVPEAIRWSLRLLAFGALVLLAGATTTALYVWPLAAQGRRLKAMALAGLGVLALSTTLQFLTLAGDIAGSAPWQAASGAGTAMRTDAGNAYGIRIAAVVGMAAALLLRSTAVVLRRWLAVTGLLVVAGVSFSLAGHARSTRWSWVGIPLDLGHLLAASVWLGGLVMMVAIVMPLANEDLVPAVRRFAVVALGSVSVVVVTGVLQSLRLLGSPIALVASGHGRLLLGKLAVLAGMLFIADANRRRVERRFTSAVQPSRGIRWALSRAMLTEAAFGAVVLAVTALLVVSPPGASEALPTNDSHRQHASRVSGGRAGQKTRTLASCELLQFVGPSRRGNSNASIDHAQRHRAHGRGVGCMW